MPTSPIEAVSFGPFEFQPKAGRLSRHGERVKLQPKSAAALRLLLETPGEVVTHARLRHALWPRDVHVDFEVGVKVAIRRLREALEDSADNPTYIQTVRGEGYRLLAPVHEKAVESVHMPAPQPGPAPPLAPWARGRWAAAAAVVCLAAWLVLFAGSGGSTLQDRGPLLIAAFENRTGERLLDGTAEYVIERELGGSRRIRVVPRDRVNDTLALMRRTPDTRLDEELARQVAVRDGAIRWVLAGRVERFGGKLVLTVRLLQPATGNSAGIVQRETTLDGFVAAARSASGEVRRLLGESFARDGDSGLEKATTPSLEALRDFTAGMAASNRRDWPSAAALYEEALGHDPQFAMAHIHAAHAYSNMRENDRAAPHFQAAFRLAPEVSARERLFILGSYSARFLHDDAQALTHYRALIGLFPDDYWGLNNLADTCARVYHLLSAGGIRRADPHRVEEIVSLWERLHGLRPANERWPANLWQVHRLTNPGKAQMYVDVLRRLAAVNPRAMELAVLAEIGQMEDQVRRGDVRSAVEELARLRVRAMEGSNPWYSMMISSAHLALGKLADAEAICQRLDGRIRAECLLRAAYVRHDSSRAREQIVILRSLGPSDRGRVQDTALAAVTGDTETALAWLPPQESKTIEGFVLLNRGETREAVSAFRNEHPEVTPGWTLWNRYGLAAALERRGRVQEAIEALEPASRPTEIDVPAQYYWPDCRMRVADLYRKAGRPGDAVRVEAEIRRVLAEADGDHPVAARLRSR